VAQLIGLSKTSLQKYLDGICYPDLKNMRRIEQALGWPVTEQIALIPYGKETSIGRSGVDHAYGLALESLIVDEIGGY
jgi:predicted transcriptional regulator